jgi:hypothetical protein
MDYIHYVDYRYYTGYACYTEAWIIKKDSMNSLTQLSCVSPSECSSVFDANKNIGNTWTQVSIVDVFFECNSILQQKKNYVSKNLAIRRYLPIKFELISWNICLCFDGRAQWLPLWK